MKKSTLFSILTIFLLVPATLLLGRHIKGRWYYLTSTLVIIEIMLPFFASFESRKPQSRELVTLAVMAALATASRVAFVFIPYFKAITGVIMITGIAFGAQAGFLTGAIAAFASNFFFSQGPWTPWQMFAYGFAGFWAGLIFHGRQKWCKPWILGIFGFFPFCCWLALCWTAAPCLRCSASLPGKMSCLFSARVSLSIPFMALAAA